MKYSMTMQAGGQYLRGYFSDQLRDKAIKKAVMAEYRAVLERADEIAPKNNPLLTAYILGAFFIAINRKTDLSPEECASVLDDGIKKSKLIRTMMGDADGYLSEKRNAGRKKWAAETQKRRYPGDWVVEVLDRTDSFDLGLNYTECGICKMFQAEGCPEWAPYLCRLDFTLSSLIGLHLDRTQTLAEGGSCCDFRFRR